MLGTNLRREKVEVVFSTKTKVTAAPAPSPKEDTPLTYDLNTSTGSLKSRHDVTEHQPSGESEKTQSYRSSNSTDTDSHEYKLSHSGEVPMRKRGRRSSRKGSDAKPSFSASVRRLRPSKALLQQESVSIADCVKAMVDARTEASLVTDSKGSLTGILTDKDIALRVVARGLDPILTRVGDVMTPNPSCVSPRASAIEALEQMVSGQFRHLPVAENGNVVGILDIAKCLYDAISKIEQAYMASSSQFAETFQKLEANMGETETSLFEKMRETLFLPTLSSMIDGTREVPEIADTATAQEASLLMLQTNSSAVMVFGTSGIMEGILTTKDLMRRVLAVGHDPSTCLVRDVMTSNPECVYLSTTILDALHTMHDGKFLHLPVLNDEGVVVGLADVLQVTCGVVNQIGSFQQQHTANVSPVWNQFWSSMFNPPEAPKPSINYSQPDSHRMDTEHAVAVPSTAPITSTPSEITPSVAPVEPLSRKPASPATFAYKLTDHVQNIHRFTASAMNLGELLQEVRNRTGQDDEELNLYYVDDEGDTVLLYADKDLEDAVALAISHEAAYLRLKTQPAARIDSTDEDLSELLDRLPNHERKVRYHSMSESMIATIAHSGIYAAAGFMVAGAAMLYAKKK
ncbi:hypothetical protein Ae201684P_005156 [Aphanomyces euteiches]|uniref:CBS domain-containing protein n=1 Tax=Aphanomyces euteiches TaxID=100861 RepID=A0A6G0X144_9STRA|nr:hypothetical protein Ae201684_009543 [Aphanomyces euteiches]KAH9085448.1 hypothetical protein Ae201684P_005156 [Aphanomyces euteiches]